MGNKEIEKVQNDNLEILLNELTEEQKQHAKTTGDLVNAVNISTGKIDNLDNKIEDKLNAIGNHFQQALQKEIDGMKRIPRQGDTTYIREVIKNGITELKLILSAQQRPVTRKFQILLFPEQDAKLFYKIVFGRWYLMVVGALFLHLAYKSFNHQQEINKQVRFEEIKTNRITKAWDYMHVHGSKSLKRVMDSTLVYVDRQEVK